MRPQRPHLDQETSGLPNGAGEIEGAGDTSWRLKMRVWKIKIELQNPFFWCFCFINLWFFFRFSDVPKQSFVAKKKRLRSLNQRQ